MPGYSNVRYIAERNPPMEAPLSPSLLDITRSRYCAPSGKAVLPNVRGQSEMGAEGARYVLTQRLDAERPTTTGG